MGNSLLWQCRNCGKKPSVFCGDIPSENTKCSATGQKHVWEKLGSPSTNSRDWQCRLCGKHPSVWSGGIPTSNSRCEITGDKHVWERL